MALVHHPPAQGSLRSALRQHSNRKQHSKTTQHMVQLSRSRTRIEGGLLGLLLLCALTPCSRGFIFSDGDLLLGFRQPGGASEVVVNLGAATNFNDLAALQAGKTFAITNYSAETLKQAFSDLTGLD